MLPLKWSKWIHKTIQLDRAEQIRREQQWRPRIEGLEMRLVPSIMATGAILSPKEGVPAIGVTVATFTDTTPSPAADYTATINWGDGTVTAGTVGGSAGSYSVTGTHTYAEDGSQAVTVTITESNGADTDTGTAVAIANIGESLLGALGLTLTTTEGSGFSGAVATFGDPGSTDPASEFRATINWGAGTTTAGTVSGGGGS
jgi:hypothetical protein